MNSDRKRNVFKQPFTSFVVTVRSERSDESREDRLAGEARQSVSAVAPCPGIGDQAVRYLGQTKCVVKFPMRQQTAVGVDRSASNPASPVAFAAKPGSDHV